MLAQALYGTNGEKLWHQAIRYTTLELDLNDARTVLSRLRAVYGPDVGYYKPTSSKKKRGAVPDAIKLLEGEQRETAEATVKNEQKR